MRAVQPIATLSGSEPPSSLDWFEKLAAHTAVLSGRPLTFSAALAVVSHGSNLPLQ